MRILVTCPPMIGMIEELRPLFSERDAEVVIPDFVQTMSEAALIDILPACDGWIIGDDPATARVLAAGAKGALRACVKWGIGVDNVDFSAAKRLGIPITNTPGVFGHEVADIAMNYVTGLARETFRVDREIRTKGTWPKPRGVSLAGKTVALVGFGDIGRQSAKRFLAAGMTVDVCDPAFDNPDALDVHLKPWPKIINDADFIVFTCPLNSGTFHMFHETALNHIKPGLRLVNVSRGPVVKETALIAGLNAGRIHSAALDVFEMEPLAADNPLRAHEHCLFGSHNASNTEEAVRHVSRMAIDQLFGFEALKSCPGGR